MDTPVSNRHTLDLDDNGYVRGFSLRNHGPSGSNFRLQSDKISIDVPGKRATLTPFYAAQYLTDPSDVAELLTAALESGNPTTVARACAIAARTAPTEGN